MKVWHIAAETRTFAATDLSGLGSARFPGRWNAEGEAVVYTATSLALAVLETVAHLDTAGLPLNRYVVEIDVPDDLWKQREDRSDPGKLPPTWNAMPAGLASLRLGSAWLGKVVSLILELPSAIVPEETVALINPKHPDAGRLKAKVLRRFEYNTVRR